MGVRRLAVSSIAWLDLCVAAHFVLPMTFHSSDALARSKTSESIASAWRRQPAW